MQTAKYYMNTQHGVTTHWRTELSLQAAVGCVRTLHSFQSVADFTDLPVASRCSEFQSDLVDIAAFVFFFSKFMHTNPVPYVAWESTTSPEV